ncbi:MAG: hypothetical protein ACE5IR_24230 [bacterium]
MNLWFPKISKITRMNQLWAKIAPTWIAPYLTHKAQVRCASSILNIFKPNERRSAELMAAGLFSRPLRGAGFGWESRYALQPEPDVASPSPFNSTGVKAHFTVRDFFTVLEVGAIFEVAGTNTALVADFDRYTAPNGAGTLTDKLDGTNGTITAPNATTAQAVGAVVYKDLGDTTPVDLNKGNSVAFDVTTAVTSGSGIPYVLGIARAEVNANLGSTVGFASS